MANWAKRDAKFKAQLKYIRARQEAMTDEEEEAEQAAWDAQIIEVSDEEEAAEVLADERGNTLVQALAKSIAEGGLPGCNACFTPLVRDEQCRQLRLREKYGDFWTGRVKLAKLRSQTAYDEKASAWRAVRWLEERGFVEVGNGYVKWVGALE